MSEFKRKTQTSGFEAGDESFGALEGAETPPDFSALEAESGFSVGQADEPIQSFEPIMTPAETVIEQEMPVERRSAPDLERIGVQPAEETPGKKRYYSPGEVMKKKGCIGCGGMALAMPLLLAVTALVIALF